MTAYRVTIEYRKNVAARHRPAQLQTAQRTELYFADSPDQARRLAEARNGRGCICIKVQPAADSQG